MSQHTSMHVKVGQRVRYENKLYKCVQAHTSQADWTTWATMVAGKRPLAKVVANLTRTSYCTVGSDGAIDVSSTVSADANYIFTAVYLLP